MSQEYREFISEKNANDGKLSELQVSSIKGNSQINVSQSKTEEQLKNGMKEKLKSYYCKYCYEFPIITIKNDETVNVKCDYECQDISIDTFIAHRITEIEENEMDDLKKKLCKNQNLINEPKEYKNKKKCLDEYFDQEFQNPKKNSNDKKYSSEVEEEYETKTILNQEGEPQYKIKKKKEEYQKPKLKELYDIILSNIEKFPNSIHYENIENIYNYLILDKFEIKYSGYKNQNVKEINIFGKDFVNNNKENCYLLINGEKKDLCEKYDRLDKESLKIILVKKKEIENMSKMFYKCNFLCSVTVLNRWKFDNVNNMKSMFDGCQNLNYINLGSELKTSKVTDFSNMFKECKSLKTISSPLNFETKNGLYFENMFKNCSSLDEINGISNWELNEAINLSSMFSGCEQLKEINLSEWDIPNVTNLNSMFYGCKNITKIIFKKGLNCSKVTNMDSMFAECENLEELYDLSEWKIDSLQSLNETFKNLPNLKKFSDISKWKVVGKVKSLKDTFEDFSTKVPRPEWADKIINNNISTVSHTFD